MISTAWIGSMTGQEWKNTHAGPSCKDGDGTRMRMGQGLVGGQAAPNKYLATHPRREQRDVTNQSFCRDHCRSGHTEGICKARWAFETRKTESAWHLKSPQLVSEPNIASWGLRSWRGDIAWNWFGWSRCFLRAPWFWGVAVLMAQAGTTTIHYSNSTNQHRQLLSGRTRIIATLYCCL
jgi:hypothetical protein